ncbi:MAG: hypothetical protein AB7O38_17010 [Pirellulaceae bacterium]
MTSSQKKKLIRADAGVWAIAILASFVFPFIAESLSSGPAKFAQVLCFGLPLVVGMVMSTVVINRSIPETAAG